MSDSGSSPFCNHNPFVVLNINYGSNKLKSSAFPLPCIHRHRGCRNPEGYIPLYQHSDRKSETTYYGGNVANHSHLKLFHQEVIYSTLAELLVHIKLDSTGVKNVIHTKFHTEKCLSYKFPIQNVLKRVDFNDH